MAKLSDKQKRFVNEYLVDLNATQAAIRAGYSEKTAHVQGPRLLGNVRVAEAVQKGREKLAARTEVTQEWVVEKLKENVENGKEWGQGATVNGALNLLGKHLGMYQEKIDLTTDGGPIASFNVIIRKPEDGEDAGD